LPSESRLVRSELDTVEFFNGFEAKRPRVRQRLNPESATSLPALHLPNQTCDDGDKPAYGAGPAQATPETSSTESARMYRLQEEASEMRCSNACVLSV
jgi:hypothetical protein